MKNFRLPKTTEKWLKVECHKKDGTTYTLEIKNNGSVEVEDDVRTLTITPIRDRVFTQSVLVELV